MSADRLTIVASRLGVGGLEKVIEKLAAGLPSRGIAVDITCASVDRDANPAWKRLVVSELGRRNRWRFALGLVRRVRSSTSGTVMSTANDLAFLARIGIHLSVGRRLHIVTLHSVIASQIAAELNLVNRARLVVMREMLRFAARRADACVAVSTPLALEFEALGVSPDRIHVIHNPVVGPDLDARLASPVHWPWPDSAAPTVAFCGRLAAVKRPDVMLDAFQQVHARRPARLLILGDGPLRGWLESEVERRALRDSVRCLGFVDDALAYLRRCDALALTSDHEGFGNVIVEALAAGIAVVATDCPSGPAEILMNGRFGILVRPGDAASVAEGLEQSLSGKGASSPAERRARAMEFSDDAALDRYAALIRALQRDGAR